jgi:hypothetical protein
MTTHELNAIKFAKRKKAKDYLDETVTISHLRIKEEKYAQLNGKEAKIIGFFIDEKHFFLKTEVSTDTATKEYYFAWDFVAENSYLITEDDNYYKMSANSGVHNFFIHTLAQINLLKIAQEKANDKKQDKHTHTDKIEKTEKEKKDKEKDKEKEKKHRGRPSKNEEARKSRMELRMTKDEKKIIKDYLEKYNAKHQSQLSVTDLLVKLCSEEV